MDYLKMAKQLNPPIDFKSIFQQYGNVPFMQRLTNRYIFPLIDNPDKSVSSHKMSWGQFGDKYYAYPSVDYFNGKLTDFTIPPWDNNFAFDLALQNNNFIPFNTPEEADFFTKNYKNYLGW